MKPVARKRIHIRLNDGIRPSQVIEDLKIENHRLRSMLESTLHEAREFSALITDRAHALSTDDTLPPKPKEHAETLFHASGMLSARLNYTDIEINPGITELQVRYGAGIYKKFHKARYLLQAHASRKNSRINLLGESRMEIPALSVFDMLPFVLLQNAVKYSPPGYHINVEFDETNNSSLFIKLSSYGPIVEDQEIPHLFEREFRGRHSKDIEGQGLGLHLAKKVCDLHHAQLSIETGDVLQTTISRRQYQKFIVCLQFTRHD
ncbi:ATP-binding protein [Pseudomonas fortuita]|uniref:ATP-binding protein n=1 Tax=Pseudomonas fortuita TaxID=3233375 RepID=UPI003D8136FB